MVVTGGEMVWSHASGRRLTRVNDVVSYLLPHSLGLAIIGPKKGAVDRGESRGEKRLTRVGKPNKSRKMKPRDRKTRLKGLKSKTQMSFPGQPRHCRDSLYS